MVLVDSNQHHWLLASILRHFTHQILNTLDTDTTELLSFSVHQMESLIRPELDLDIPLGVVVEPLLDVHLVHGLAIVVLLPLGLDLPPPGVHDLDHAIGRAGQGQRDEDHDNAAKDVGNLRPLEVVITCK